MYRSTIISCLMMLGMVMSVQAQISKIPKVNMPTQIDPLAQVLQEEMIQQEITGMAVGVIKDGKIMQVKAYGHLDKNRTQPVTTETIFRWASISKTVTAVLAVMQHANNAKFSFLQKVHELVDGWPKTGDKGNMTVLQLMANSSGMPHYPEFTYDLSNYNAIGWNAEQALEVLMPAKLVCKPGACYHYSSFGFTLLGLTMEKITNLDYWNLVMNCIPDRHQYKMPSFQRADTYAYTKGYKKDCSGGWEERTIEKTAWKLPSGGWASDIKDLTTFMLGMLDTAYTKALPIMWTMNVNHKHNTTYKLGVHSIANDGFGTKVWHGGLHDNVSTLMEFYPDKRLGIALMIPQGDGINTDRIARKIKNALNLGVVFPVGDTPNNWYPKKKNSNYPKECGADYNALWIEKSSARHAILRKGYTHSEFGKEWKHLASYGYKLTDMEVYYEGGQLKWDGVFYKSSVPTALWRGFTTTDFGKKWQEMARQGYRIADIEVYKAGSELRWSGIFVKDGKGQALWRNQTYEQFNQKWNEMKAQGKRLIDIETYMDGNTRKWAGVWVNGSGQGLYRDMTKEEFLRQDFALEKEYQLIDVETYMDGNTRKWAGVWVKTNKKGNQAIDTKYGRVLYVEKRGKGDNPQMELIDLNRMD